MAAVRGGTEASSSSEHRMAEEERMGEGEREGEGEGERVVRERRNQETRDELEKLKKQEKVHRSLQTIIANRLERTQLQKVLDGPIHRVKPKQKLPLRRRSLRGQHHRCRSGGNGGTEPAAETGVSNTERRKKRRKSWVVGQFGGEGIKNRREGDEEELKQLRNMGVVRERLKEKEKFRAQARKFFKHRYELDPDSTQKSSCILVTGYEEGEDSTQKATNLIRQQSIIVIQNFFNPPVKRRTVLKRLTSIQRHGIEEIEKKKVSGRGGHSHTLSEPFTVKGVQHEGENFVGGEGISREDFHWGKSMDERKLESTGGEVYAMVGRSDWIKGSSNDDDRVICEAPPISQSPPPLVPLATPLAPPPSSPPADVSSSETNSSGSARNKVWDRTPEQPRRYGLVDGGSNEEGAVFEGETAHHCITLRSQHSRDVSEPAHASVMSDSSECMEETDSALSDSTSPVHIATVIPESVTEARSLSFMTEADLLSDFVALPQPLKVSNFSDRVMDLPADKSAGMDDGVVSTVSRTCLPVRGAEIEDESEFVGPSSPQVVEQNGVDMDMSPHCLKRSMSYVTAMETGDVAAAVVATSNTKAATKVKSKSAKSSTSKEREKPTSKDRGKSSTPKQKDKASSKDKASHKKWYRFKSEDKKLHITSSREGSAEMKKHITGNEVGRGSDGDILTGLSSSAGMVREEREIVGKERGDISDSETRPDNPERPQPASPLFPAHPPPPSPPLLSPPPPSPPPPLAKPSRPFHHLSPQFSVASLPGRDTNDTRFYTPLSPRIDSLTGTHAGDVNPFAADFDRALRAQSRGEKPGPRPPAVSSNLSPLPEEVINDEGFCNFLQTQGAKPTRSLYITYSIMKISEQIDCKYSKQLNQALDAIFHEVLRKELSWDNFSTICRQLMFQGEGLKDGLFMVPAFGRRLLGFLPGMRGVITMYTQAVFDEYAMDWLLMRGGWGELLRHYSQEEEEGEETEEVRGEAGLGDTDRTPGVWFVEDESYSDEGSIEGETEDMYHTAMGYGLVTPAPESQSRSLATAGRAAIDITDVGTVLGAQMSVRDEDEGPHPPCILHDLPTEMGSELFLAPVHDIIPPIGRGLRRVISVEVLFTADECDSTAQEEREAIRTQSLNRVSSVPSMSSSIPSPTCPIPIPSQKHLSTDQSGSGTGMGPVSSSPSFVFSLPSMRRNKPHPLSRDNLASSPSSTDFTRQASTTSMDSGIHIITAGSGMSPSPPASAGSPLKRRRFEPSQLAQQNRGSGAEMLMVTNSADCNRQDDLVSRSSGCVQLEATPTSEGSQTTSTTLNNTQMNDETPPTNDQTTPTSDDTNQQATPPTNEDGFLVQRSLTDSSDGYADYGLGSGSMTEWERTKHILLLPVLPVVIVTSIILIYSLFRSR